MHSQQTNITVSGPTRAAILAALGGETQSAVSVSLETLSNHNEHLAREALDLESTVNDLEEQLDARDKTLLAIAKLIDAVPDDTLPEVVAAALLTRGRGRSDLDAENRRLQTACTEALALVDSRWERIQALEAEVLTLRGADNTKPSPPIQAFESQVAGRQVVLVWADGSSCPATVKASDPESGKIHVGYTDSLSRGGYGDTWVDPDKLRPWPEAFDIEQFRTWRKLQLNSGVDDGSKAGPLDFKRLVDADLVDPKLTSKPAEKKTRKKKDETQPAPKPPTPNVTPESAEVAHDGKWANDLDPTTGERRPAPGEQFPPQSVTATVAQVEEAPRVYPNPAAPDEVQAATKARAEFEGFPEAELKTGIKVACWTAAGQIAVGHLDAVNELDWDYPALVVRMLNGMTVDFKRDCVRGIPEGHEPQPALVGAASAAPPDDDFTIDDF